ncbi:MAG: hypothetical protein R6X16_06740 [Anaerolineae bacterium]
MAHSLFRILRVVRYVLSIVLLCLSAACGGCGLLRTELETIVEPPPDVAPTNPVVGASPPTTSQAPGVPPTHAVQKEVTAVANTQPQPTAVVLQGGAGNSSVPVSLPPGSYRASIQHDGDGRLVLSLNDDDKGQLTTLLDVEGDYDGELLMGGVPSGAFDVIAAGDWGIEISRITTQANAAFGGVGDAVSDMFTAPPAGAWRIVHEGEGPFSATLRCVAGESTVLEGSGPLAVSQEIAFPKGFCLWIVKASGAWSLAPAE